MIRCTVGIKSQEVVMESSRGNKEITFSFKPQKLFQYICIGSQAELNFIHISMVYSKNMKKMICYKFCLRPGTFDIFQRSQRRLSHTLKPMIIRSNKHFHLKSYALPIHVYNGMLWRFTAGISHFLNPYYFLHLG